MKLLPRPQTGYGTDFRLTVYAEPNILRAMMLSHLERCLAEKRVLRLACASARHASECMELLLALARQHGQAVTQRIGDYAIQFGPAAEIRLLTPPQPPRHECRCLGDECDA